MEHITNKLQYKTSLPYFDVRSPLIILSGSSNLPSDGDAANLHSHEVDEFKDKNNNSVKQKPSRPGKTTSHKGNPYLHCKDHYHHYEGYSYEFCNQLQTDREGTSSPVPPPAPARDVIPDGVNLTMTKQYDHRVALIMCSFPHALSTMPSANTLQTINDKIYELWLFDIGACLHIIRDFSHLLELICCHDDLTIHGVACLHSTHMRSVQLDVEISSSVLSVTRSDVSYLPD